MKELSIEEKAKAYDKAFRIAQELYNDPNSSNVGKRYVYTVLPEFKVSEDEKIRKELLSFLKAGSPYYCPNNKRRQEWVTWLEKQGEQKPAIEMKSAEESLGIDSNTYNEIVDECIYGKQKPTDKVEPKFHEGEWIVWQNKFYKVNDNGCGYELVDQNGLSTSLEYGTVDENAHLWTIKDAKPGDILFHSDSASNGIFIFKELLKYEFSEKVICYCDYDSEDHFCLGEHHTCCWADAKILHPATKEQCNLLFQKMKKAGYEWDVEKKELKKQDEIEIPFGAKDSELQEAVYNIPKGFHAEVERNKVVIKQGEHNSAWSEEDTETLNGIVNYLFTSTDVSSIEGSDKWYDWLKSLKNRVIPKQEWSEEDEEMLNVVIKSCEQCGNEYAYSWLKSLKERMNN